MQAKHAVFLMTSLSCLLVIGCSATRSYTTQPGSQVTHPVQPRSTTNASASVRNRADIEQVAFEQTSPDTEPTEEDDPPGEALPSADLEIVEASFPTAFPLEHSTLTALVATAVDQNSRLVSLYREYQAAAARSRYIAQLPDPKLGANLFGNPIETAAGSQRANMNLSQTIPWLGKLNGQQQQACLEAFAIRAEYAAERLQVIAGVRAGWYRLYVLDRQIETTEANQELLESLIDVANARIATGNASQGDVLLGTLELAKLEERLLTFRKQRHSVEAEINRLVGRSADVPIESPTELAVGTIDLDARAVQQIAMESQPEFEAARLRTQATCWGIEIARLSRRPELMLSASYFVTDDNRPASPVVNVGEDPWAVGLQVSLPIWCEKYDALQNEARWKHQAAHASVHELADRYDALIRDLVSEAERAAETAALYRETIIPQARQTLSADQESYSSGNVEFDRVIRDYRNLLMLELGFHEAMGELAIANARIRQAAGRDIATSREIKDSSTNPDPSKSDAPQP